MNQPVQQDARSVTRPFVGGVREARPFMPSSVPPRPFPRVAARPDSQGAPRAPVMPTPRWSVAVYEPGMDALALEAPAPALDLMPGSLELPLTQANGREEASAEEAAVLLEGVAQRLRAGEILLPAGTSPRNEADIVAAVLAAMTGERR